VLCIRELRRSVRGCVLDCKYLPLRDMVAREGLEPPPPAFSELIFPVFPTTSRVAVGLLNTGKYEQHEWTVGDSTCNSRMSV
jgi:hypothetical protein